MKMVGAFVDVGNLYFSINQKWDGRKLDYVKYLQKAVGKECLYRAIAYGGQLANHAATFITYLKAAGFETKYKELRQFELADQRKVWRVDWNVGMSVDVIKMINRLDIVILGSSNIDLVPLVEYIKNRGITCIIFACGIPKDLRSIADGAIEIDESLLEEIPTPAEMEKTQ